MPRLIVLFDANAYIAGADEWIVEVAARQRSNGIVSWASYFVLDELLARTGDTDPRNSGKGANALRRLLLHCKTYDGVERVEFVADPRWQAAEMLFGVTRPRTQRPPNVYANLVATIAADTSGTTWKPWIREILSTTREHIALSEREYVEGLFSRTVRMLVPSAKTWTEVRTNPRLADALAEGVASSDGFDLCARLLTLELAELTDSEVTPEKLEAAVSSFKDCYAMPIRLYNALMYRILKYGTDAAKAANANTVWDAQLSMTVPRSSRFAHLPVWLVTDDRAIHDAARESGAGHLFHKRERYWMLLNDSDALLAEIDQFGSAGLQERPDK